MVTLLSSDLTELLLASLRSANENLAREYPGESGQRQPVHTVYGGAHLFRADSVKRLGELALRSLDLYAPDATTFAEALGWEHSTDQVTQIYKRIREKLEREPVEDFRIDFEDGYGNRPDAEEDACAVGAAEQVALGVNDSTLSPFIGIRIKPLTPELHGRAFRTLEIFLNALLKRSSGVLPEQFVITLPKVMVPEQVAASAKFINMIESQVGLAEHSLKIELMIETTQSIIGSDGRCTLPALVAAADGRCIAAHFGVYDYTASCNITAHHQGMIHPACDFARHMMQVALSGTGIMLSDGATNIMPIAPHRAAKEGPPLTPQQLQENKSTVHRAWRKHYDDVRHSLRHAYYQGWDLHPAQLPTRYAAAYMFFQEGLASASERLRNFIEKAAQATLVGDIFDDAATGQGLLNFFLRGINCGAITEDEALKTGLTLDELRSRSFVHILRNRRQA